MAATAHKVLDILTLFGPGTPVVTAPLVAARFRLSRSTTYRYLQLLKARGFLAGAGAGGYRLGPQLAALGRLANGPGEIDEVALPVMRDLARQTGETILLTKELGDQVVTAQRVESARAVRVSFEPGVPRPLHAGASAKVLLAYLPAEAIEEILRRGRLARLTPRTITDPRRLRADLARIRGRGYAVTTGEVDEGVRGIAVPLRDPEGTVVAGLSLAGPAFRVKREHIPRILRQLRDAACRIEGLLAYPADGRGAGSEAPAAARNGRSAAKGREVRTASPWQR